MPAAWRTHELRPSAPTTSRAAKRRPSSSVSVALGGRPRERRESRAGARRRRPARESAGSSAARNARSSTIHASARSPSSYAEKSSVAPVSPTMRIDSIAAMRSHGQRLPRADASQERRAAGADRIDARVPRVRVGGRARGGCAIERAPPSSRCAPAPRASARPTRPAPAMTTSRSFDGSFTVELSMTSC